MDGYHATVFAYGVGPQTQQPMAVDWWIFVKMFYSQQQYWLQSRVYCFEIKWDDVEIRAPFCFSNGTTNATNQEVFWPSVDVSAHLRADWKWKDLLDGRAKLTCFERSVGLRKHEEGGDFEAFSSYIIYILGFYLAELQIIEYHFISGSPSCE